jgi:protein TonB
MIATFSSTETLVTPTRSASPTRKADPSRPAKNSDLSLVAVSTLVLWLGCAGVGVMGIALPYPHPQPVKIAPPPVHFEQLRVELTDAPLPQPGLSALPPDLAAPPPPLLLAQPNVPQPIAVAELSPAVAFAVPIEGPVRIVDAAHAGVTRSTVSAVAVAGPSAPVQSLVFGQGEGRQPAPTYPPHASQLGQEGMVAVRFSVDETGRVSAAEAAQPCPWVLLNEAAVRTVRERWRFAAGALRNYEVAIHFRLKK